MLRIFYSFFFISHSLFYKKKSPRFTIGGTVFTDNSADGGIIPRPLPLLLPRSLHPLHPHLLLPAEHAWTEKYGCSQGRYL